MSVSVQPASEIQPPVPRWAPRGLSPSASAHLDAIRAIAASAVLWDHIRGLFFVDFPELRNPSLPLKTLYFVTGFGRLAVIVFFVLSGFLISSAILKRAVAGTWSW